MRRTVAAAAMIIAAALIFTSCTSSAEKHTEEFYSMDTFMRLTVYGDAGEAKAAKEIILKCEEMYGTNCPGGEVWRLNNGEAVLNPSQGLTDMLMAAGEMNVLSGGKYDLTVLPLMRLWGFAGDGGFCVPSEEELRDALQSVGMDGVRIENGAAALENRLIDLGSCAKGYAANEAAKYLKNAGVECAVLTLGGNVQTVGRKPDGGDFVIGIANPFEPQALLGTLRVGECAVVTSGTYQRYFETDGKVYSHIIDATTGYPCDSGLVSVTVICPDGMKADMLSTVLMLIGLDGLNSMYSDVGGFEAVAVSASGDVSVTPGIEERFTLSDNYSAAN